MNGILNVCKPRGISSFKALSIVKARLAKELGIPSRRLKVGHLGTLDPAACGVLVLLCGKATKLADKLHGSTKVYRSMFTFGLETDTLDNEGEVVTRSEVIPTKKQIQSVLGGLLGEVEIEIPKFSAVHIDGKRAYDLARQGIDFVAPKRVVNVKRFELLGMDDCMRDLERISESSVADDGKSFYFEIECQTGTYIRSLAKLMAQKLGTVAIASLIIRTKVGQFEIGDTKGVEEINLGDLISIKEVN